jgi:superfamily II DNA helicase RecQ
MADMEEVKKKIIEKFGITDLNSHQERAIDALRRGNDVFVGTKTGSGKSLIYESAPLALKETGVTTVLAPLTSIMTEQVERLKRLGYRATDITGDTDRTAVMNGDYQFVFASPETLVGDPKWRDILKTDTFSRKHHLIVVDEAHTVVQW